METSQLVIPSSSFVPMDAVSVTRFGEISPLWKTLTSLWQIFDSLFVKNL